MLVVYTGPDEVLVCELENEHEVIAEYFSQGSGRDIDDYDRDSTKRVVEISTQFKVSLD